MSKLIPIIASAFHADQSQLQSELQDYVIDFRNSNLSGDTFVFYPGKILKGRTEQLQSQEPWIFKPDQVWDKKAWGNTGNEVPSWIRGQHGNTIQNANGENYSIPELYDGIPQNPSPINPMAFLRNPPYSERS